MASAKGALPRCARRPFSGSIRKLATTSGRPRTPAWRKRRSGLIASGMELPPFSMPGTVTRCTGVSPPEVGSSPEAWMSLSSPWPI